jgi:hypothetical protein
MANSPHGFSAITPLTPEPYVTADEAAPFIHLDRKTLLRWAREGKVPNHPYPTGNKFRNGRLFLLSELDKWMKGEIDSQGRPYPGKATSAHETKAA